MTSPRNSGEQSTGGQVYLHGRGGAGNLSSNRRESFKEDLVTPIIKSDTYTTGRGGTGNMARNDPSRPELARASQDVDPPAHREPGGEYHTGRGGAGNKSKSTADGTRLVQAREEQKKQESQGEDTASNAKSWAEKSKDIFSKIGSKK